MSTTARPPLDPVRKRYRRALFQSFVVRFHALLIVAAVVGAGLGLNRLWLGLGFEHLIARSVFNCFVTWGVFLLAVRVWVLYAHLVDERLAALHPDEAALAPPDPPLAEPKSASSASDTAEGSLQVARGLAEVAVDADVIGAIFGGVALAIAALVALAAVLPWLWVEVPAMLVEAAFQVALSASLVRRAGRLARAAEGPGWLGVLVVGTWGPMAIVTVIVLAVTTLAHFACDAPTRLSGCFLP
jgi:hypothetical protein